MQYDLVVTSAFKGYQIGDRITDPVEVAAITVGDPFHYCVQVAHDGTDTTAPTITVSPSQTVAENTAFLLTLTANEAVTWAKVGGADAALFTLSGSTLTLPAQNFEAPADSNGDNAYVVNLTATDAAGNASPLTVTVTVTDVAEGTTPPANDNSLALTLDLGSSLAAF